MDRSLDTRFTRFAVGACDYAAASTPSQDRGAVALTRAEYEVATLLASGATNLEIARTRGKSVSTIANQAASVFRKLGVFSRLQLAAQLGTFESPLDEGESAPPSRPCSAGTSATGGVGSSVVGIGEALRRRALAADDAPGAAVATNAVDTWQALCSGEWLLADHFHARGRYWLVLRSSRSSPGAAARVMPSLCPSLLQWVALGNSSKAIAIDLGLAPSTISVLLKGYFEQLGLPCRVAVAQLLGPFARAAAGIADPPAAQANRAGGAAGGYLGMDGSP